ncbi:uncharacterized protein LOC117651319 [Thrips palmi]|uniref:Uncharacterized protein LOC117651319 n=1 Tax=Thrips palmi TaxID=161013 RepID=A0A6P9A0Z2_THRPL|nr:uncharacterized protein LOC117651319 [Thrips palmi]
MGRNCFILKCKGNKNRYVTDLKKTLPAFFRFPKDADLFDEWKKVVPPRTFKHNPKRYPTDKDYLCSLHFKKEDVIKHYEISSIKGCPENEVVKIERGRWILKPDAVPCFFSDDNPDAKLMVHERRTKRSTSLSKREVPSMPTGIGHNCKENECIDTETTCSNGKPDTPEVTVPNCSVVARIDHNYHLPFRESTGGTRMSVVEETTANVSTHSSSSNKCESESYTVEQLHQDVLEIKLPKNWTFVQNDDDYSTQFISYGEDMSVKCVKFTGTCLPSVTICGSIQEHGRVCSKQDIEELLASVSVL